MTRLRRYLFSLVMTGLISFTIPVGLTGSVWLALAVLQRVYGGAGLGQQGLHQLQQVLIILGSGHPWQGLMVMGLTFSSVGILFDTFTFISLSALKPLPVDRGSANSISH